jgi:very-short-patch-repair endonuclease
MYSKLSDDEKRAVLTKLYLLEQKSLGQIAQELETYPNKIRRDAKKFNIALRNKSDAQKNALQTGVHKHPTKGTQRSDDVKQKIGESVMISWDQLSTEELEARKNSSKEQWQKLSDDQKQNMLKLANEAVRKTSKEGSKLEKFLLQGLLKDGYVVDFHKEQILSNSKLQIDLFLPKLNIAIEVDGPSHFKNIWGDDTLNRNTKYDQKKQGLLVGKGIRLIRIKQNGDFSLSRARGVYSKVLLLIENINLDSVSVIEY